MSTTEIITEIRDCTECQHFERKRYYTEDSFEMVFEQRCSKEFGRRIAIVDATEKQPCIPDWCTFKEKKSTESKKLQTLEEAVIRYRDNPITKNKYDLFDLVKG